MSTTRALMSTLWVASFGLTRTAFAKVYNDSFHHDDNTGNNLGRNLNGAELCVIVGLVLILGKVVYDKCIHPHFLVSNDEALPRNGESVAIPASDSSSDESSDLEDNSTLEQDDYIQQEGHIHPQIDIVVQPSNEALLDESRAWEFLYNASVNRC